MSQAYDFLAAEAASNTARAAQLGAETAVADAWDAYAVAEQAYRVALSRRIVELRASGLPATVCQDVAKGEDEIAQLRYQRDVQLGVRKATEHAPYRFAADRKDVLALIEWARGIDLRSGGLQHEGPREDVPPVGSPGYQTARAA